MEPVREQPALAGRVTERASLVALVRRAVEGRPGAVLVHGEAGVGKTSLVRSVADEVRADGVQVLWGSGLRFDAAEALLLPITMAFDRWLRDAGPDTRERALTGVPGVGAVLPSLGRPDDEVTETRRVVVVDALLNRILELGPVLLVVDDVQWADQASLTALAYLIAGFSRQPLALVTTHRDEDSHHADEFRTWFGDMRRMPSVDVLALDRLDRETTRSQVTGLIGTEPTDTLLDQVFRRSEGNAYLTELLVSETGPHAEVLPEPLPTALQDALLSAWQRLSHTARALTRTLAVAGRPAELSALGDVVLALDGEPLSTAALHQAIDAGIVVRAAETVWFRHPLLADVLMEQFLPGEAASIHAAWAGVLASTRAAGIDEMRRQASLALHYEAAGDAHGAFEASCRAAALAEEQRWATEAARHLVRAADLWARGAPDPADGSGLLDLLVRAEQMCDRADRGVAAHALVARARQLVDEVADPLRASRLLMDWAELEFELGHQDEPQVADLVRAAELASSVPHSPEYAEALAMQSTVLRWTGRDEEASTRAEEAVAAARSSGSTLVLSEAMDSLAATRRDLRSVERETGQALAYARESGDDLRLSYAYGACAEMLNRSGRLAEQIDLLHEALAHATAHGRGAHESLFLATALLDVGDLRAADEALREGLSIPGRVNASVSLRLTAAVVASRRGDEARVELHRQRAYELMPSLERRMGGAVTAPALAELLLAESVPTSALDLLIAAMPTSGVDTTWPDVVLLWGCRAAADVVEGGRDAREPGTVDRGRAGLAQLLRHRAELPGRAWEPSCDTDLVRPAMGALFEADRRRATGEGDELEAWREAAALCERAGMRWDQHLALWHVGALLVGARDGGSEAAEALRSAHGYFVEQGALPMLERVRQTADLGRISLTEPVQPARREARPAAFAQLTEREAEVLSYLVANRTNAEIAERLFISTKTVSVHVSNLLRKTSTTSRQEVAALALRLGWDAQSHP